MGRSYGALMDFLCFCCCKGRLVLLPGVCFIPWNKFQDYNMGRSYGALTYLSFVFLLPSVFQTSACSALLRIFEGVKVP